MSPKEADDTITIRVESNWKAKIVEAAKTENRNLTEFLIASANERANSLCETCGRTDRAAGAGFTRAFADFIQHVHDDRIMWAVTIETQEPRGLVAYSGPV